MAVTQRPAVCPIAPLCSGAGNTASRSAIPLRQNNMKVTVMAKEEAARVEALADSWRDAKACADEYSTIARNLKKEARKLERQAAQFLKNAAADRKKAKSYSSSDEVAAPAPRAISEANPAEEQA